MPGTGDMAGAPDIPGPPPNCAAARPSGITASASPNGRAPLALLTCISPPAAPFLPPPSLPPPPPLRRRRPLRGRERSAQRLTSPLSRHRVALESRRQRTRLQLPRRRMAQHAPARETLLRARHRRTHEATAQRAQPALPVRTTQTCPPRLHDTEGGGDGRLTTAAGPHAPLSSRARQPRAHARKYHRGRGAVRHPDASRHPRAVEPRADARRARARAL